VPSRNLVASFGAFGARPCLAIETSFVVMSVSERSLSAGCERCGTPPVEIESIHCERPLRLTPLHRASWAQDWANGRPAACRSICLPRWWCRWSPTQASPETSAAAGWAATKRPVVASKEITNLCAHGSNGLRLGQAIPGGAVVAILRSGVRGEEQPPWYPAAGRFAIRS